MCFLDLAAKTGSLTLEALMEKRKRGGPEDTSIRGTKVVCFMFHFLKVGVRIDYVEENIVAFSRRFSVEHLALVSLFYR